MSVDGPPLSNPTLLRVVKYAPGPSNAIIAASNPLPATPKAPASKAKPLVSSNSATVAPTTSSPTSHPPKVTTALPTNAQDSIFSSDAPTLELNANALASTQSAPTCPIADMWSYNDSILLPTASKISPSGLTEPKLEFRHTRLTTRSSHVSSTAPSSTASSVRSSQNQPKKAIAPTQSPPNRPYKPRCPSPIGASESPPNQSSSSTESDGITYQSIPVYTGNTHIDPRLPIRRQPVVGL